MKHLLIAAVILVAAAASAQTVNITGTVEDINGSLYVNGSGKVDLVPSNQQWLFNGTNPVNSPVPIAQLSSTGQFSIQLTNTSLISPASANPQWQFSFCSNPALTGTPICFTMTPLSLTSSQDITGQIQAQAAILPSKAGGCIATAATLSSKCGTVPGTVASITDGANSTDCTVGGGTNKNACIYNGAIWAPLGGGGGGGGCSLISSNNGSIVYLNNSLACTSSQNLTYSEAVTPRISVGNNTTGPGSIQLQGSNGGVIANGQITYSLDGTVTSPAGSIVLGQTGNNLILGAFGQTDFCGINSISRSGGVVTLTVASSFCDYNSGQWISVTGVTDTTYNGNFLVTSTSCCTGALQQLTYTQAGATTTSSGGHVALYMNSYVWMGPTGALNSSAKSTMIYANSQTDPAGNPTGLNLLVGASPASNSQGGGPINIQAADSNSLVGASPGGDINIRAGSAKVAAANNRGGNINLFPGSPSGTGIKGGITFNGQANTWASGSGTPSGNCVPGSIYSNSAASTLATTLYGCAPANTWSAFGAGGSSIWSSLTNPASNLSLTMGTNTTTYNIGDFGTTGGPAFSYLSNATSTTDFTTNVLIGTGATDRHTPLVIQAANGINQAQLGCWAPGPNNFNLFGSAGITCSSISFTPFPKNAFVSATPSHTIMRLFQGAASPTGTMEEFNFTSAASTAFNVFQVKTGCGADTETGCTVMSTFRGDGLFSNPIFNATTGFQFAGTAPLNHCLVGNGTNYVDAACPGGGLPSGTGLPISVASTVTLGTTNVPNTDIRWFFTTPFPNATQATAQDFGAVLAAALAASGPGQCVSLAGLNILGTAMYATTNPYVGMGTGSNPCIKGGDFPIIIGATWESPAGSYGVEGDIPPTLGNGLILQPCNTTGGCVSPGGITVPQFTNSSTCSSSGGLNCWATGLPGESTSTQYATGTVTCSLRTCTGSGTGWTTANVLVGAYFLSSCATNTCTVGSTSSYVTGRVVALNTSTQQLTLEGTWAGVTTSGQNYLIVNPNTSIAYCDGCLTSSAQKASTGHLFRNFGIDNNGVGGLWGYYTKAVQEGTEYDNFFSTLQQGTPNGATSSGGCMAWDNTWREANSSGQTFSGHWNAHAMRCATGQNTAGANSYGWVVEGFSQMDGTVGASAAAGPAEFHCAAVIGGSSTRFFDDLYIDGTFDGRYYGCHLEGVSNDNVEVGAVNPTYGNLIEGFSSSGTLTNAVVELHSGTSGNQVKAITRPSGGVLMQDDNLTTPVVATSISGTPSSWTMVEYLQPGNGGYAINANGGTIYGNTFQFNGPLYIFGPVPATPMNPTTSGNSAIGISNDGNLYLSNNGAPIDEFCTAGNRACGFNAAVVKTASYTGNSTADSGNLIVMNCSSACTYTFNGSPATGYWGGVISIGSTVATISLNSKNFNGASTVPVLISDQTLPFNSDGSNYFGSAPLAAGSNVTLTPASNALTIASSGGGGGGTVGSSDVTAQSTSQSTTTIATAPAAANYNLRYYANVNTPCTTGANTVSFTMNWTDAKGAKVLTTGTMSLGSSSNSSYLGGEMPIRVGSGNVTYSSTITGSCGSGTSSYDVHMVLTQ